MKEIFRERRQAFLAACIKYSRYVFNDHFVLVLLVFLGFLSLQYRQLLENFPQQPWHVYLLVLVLTLLLFVAGHTATYLLEADQHFLLTKEKQVGALVQQAALRQMVLWGLIQVLGQLLFLPLYLKLGFPIWGFFLFVLALTVGKHLLIQARLTAFFKENIFQWHLAIDKERKRQQTILQFFALFTKVKGITNSVKRRAYLDPLLKLVVRKHNKTWNFLYLRAFLRSGDFLGLTVRLFALSALVLVSIEVAWLAVGLVVLLNYLLLFQLLALYRVYDYQYLSRLYPIGQEKKIKGFKDVLQGLLYGIFVFQVVLGFFVLKDKSYLGVLLGSAFLLNHLYLGIKVKKLID